MRWVAVASFLLLSLYFLLRSVHIRARSRALLRFVRHFDVGTPKEPGSGVLHRVKGRVLRALRDTRYAGRLEEAFRESGTADFFRRPLTLISLLLLPPALALTITGSPLSIPPAMVAALFAPFPLLGALKRRNERMADERCEQFVEGVAVFLRCGMPVEEAIYASAEGAGPRLSIHVERFRAGVACGIGVSGALKELAASLNSKEFELLASAVATSIETGSDIRVIVEAVGQAVRERAALKRELLSQTVQGRLSGRIVAGLPIVFLLLSAFTSRANLAVLFGTAQGLLLLLAAGFLELVGFLWIRRILDIGN